MKNLRNKSITMERRIAIKQLALASGGVLGLPAWANAWTRTSIQSSHSILAPTEAALLAELIDTLIPASDTPGAKAVGVPDFVQKMIADCYEPPVQQQVKDGLNAVDVAARLRFGQSFSTCTVSQRTDVLKTIEMAPEATLKSFFGLIKTLTIQGFTTSEYVMTNFLNYNMIPGHYYGCVPAPTTTR